MQSPLCPVHPYLRSACLLPHLCLLLTGRVAPPLTSHCFPLHPGSGGGKCAVAPTSEGCCLHDSAPCCLAKQAQRRSRCQDLPSDLILSFSCEPLPPAAPSAPWPLFSSPRPGLCSPIHLRAFLSRLCLLHVICPSRLPPHRSSRAFFPRAPEAPFCSSVTQINRSALYRNWQPRLPLSQAVTAGDQGGVSCPLCAGPRAEGGDCRKGLP